MTFVLKSTNITILPTSPLLITKLCYCWWQ